MSDLRAGAALFADIAAATELRARVGDREADALLDPLIMSMTMIIRQHRGQVIKSDGDDVLAVFDRPRSFVNDCALAAIECQQDARNRGRSLYAGLHTGMIEFREVLGRPDVAGMAVNMAARLHKLVPDLPGNIFVAAESVVAMSEILQDRMRPYGIRPIKGVGQVEIFTLDWNDADGDTSTHFAVAAPAQQVAAGLMLKHGGRSVRLAAGQPPVQLGRDRHCELPIHDPEQRVSSRHIKLHSRNGAWHLQDVSRNGTWVRFDGHSSETVLLGEEIKLIGNGRFCLARPLAEDPGESCTVVFEIDAT